MYNPDDPLRAALAEQAARQILRGRSPAALYPRLRRQTTAELSADAQRTPLPRRALALSAALEALLCAVQFAVRRRPGWLRVSGLRELPADFVMSARPALLQAALLSFLRDCLLCCAVAHISCNVMHGAALLRLRSPHRSCGTETVALLSALSRACGGAVLFNAASGFTAVLRLPAAAAPPCAPVYAPTAENILNDRFSPLYLYLYGLCADPWE